ncbi:MAG: DUF502 domain-containing protein [Arenicellales bacterium]|jgi:uncharacterized membrane protein|nr:hypothetical protein [Acidiferrobacteraceae bacterium]MDP6123433.1 DUF502 domain-containing protein [Arenicellales bacterium]MDP6289375.1 DUF502 domain-containing protein [Arenicellales bacterium]MDP7156431.1 DUF502 domain-containing protein [Arenicellales bacterium]MDP7283994.1 DUF502 domain-containing protein [Arenicellales bacterium]|tara:strand:- start:1151 stop:1780 length:630 start_codon:yes stop_codon:yes gene_type:complete
MKRYLVAGLLVWLPLVVTIFAIRFLVNLMDRTLLLLPTAYQPETLFGFNIPGLGVLLALLVVFLTGIVVANFFGRQLVRLWEQMLARIPLVRSIYSAVKQIVETLFSGQGKSFRKVVMVEWPRRDMWTLAFVTGDAFADFEKSLGKSLVHLYVPTTPNPTSGFFVMVPREDVRELEISVDEGLKMILTTGVVTPHKESDEVSDNPESSG